jgi:hypothetical protein
VPSDPLAERRGARSTACPPRVAVDTRALLGLLLFAGLVSLAGTSCANELPPPGAHPDVQPPSVVEITPKPDSIQPDFRGDIRIRFDEPITVGRNIATELIASPAGRYEVQAGFSDLRVRPRDGWRVAVYCIELPAGIQDLLRNRTESAIDFCFSTGPEISATMVTGEVYDAVSGESVRDGRVLFLALPEDSTPYTAATDQEGSFGLQALPPATYWAFGFVAQNRNFELDRTLEPHDSTEFTLSGETSSATLRLTLLPADTTPPLLATAEAVDSLLLQLRFDDYLPRSPGAEGRVTVREVDSNRQVPVRFVLIGELSDLPDSLRPEPPDSAETVPGDEEIPPADSVETLPGEAELGPVEAEPEPEEERREEREPLAVPGEAVRQEREGRRTAVPQEGPPLPTQSVIVLLKEALRPATYRVFAEGFLNLRQLSGGGDTVFVYEAEEDTTQEPERGGRRR